MSDKPSIFLLIRSLETGGAERQLTYLAKELHSRGFTVTVGLFYRRGPLVGELEAAGVPVIDLGKKGRWDIPVFIVRVRSAVVSNRSEVLYSFLGGANIIAAAVRLLTPGIRLVWSIRGSDKDFRRYDWTFPVTYRLEAWISRIADLIIANSHAGLEYAVGRGFAPRRTAVVPNGIDTDRFRPQPVLRREQRSRWGLPAGSVAIGVLARLDPMKGHETFLRAAAIAARSRPELRFFCVGEGREQGRLEALASELLIAERVVFTGRLDPVPALNGLDVYCSPSSFGEGFSNSIAEAMACGLRCVVTDVGDSALIVGNCGTVVSRDNPEKLAAAILWEADRLPVRQASTARRRVVANFSIGQMVDKTVRLFQSDWEGTS